MTLDLDNRSVFGTEGSGHQKKCWVTMPPNGSCLVKVNSKFREDEKECSASGILLAAGVPHAHYSKISVVYEGQTRRACICSSFLQPSESSVSFTELLDRDFAIPMKEPAVSVFGRVCRRVAENTKTNEAALREYVMRLMTLDYLFCNSDRHYGNIEVILSPVQARLAPYYDFGKSFLGTNHEPTRAEIERGLRSFKTKPFSTNPAVNLIDRSYAKAYCQKLLGCIAANGGLEAITINAWHKKLFSLRAKQLLALKD